MFSSLRYLILSLTCRCNLHCRYCYQAAGPHGLDMSETIVDQALNLADNGQPILIQISGGEPTLLPEIIERICNQSQLFKTRPHLALQTNGTLLTPSLVRLFKKFNVRIGVSIDGPPDIQEELRGQASATLQGLKLLEEAGVEFRVTTVVSGENVLSLDRLALLLAAFSNCRGIGLDLLIDKGRGSNSTLFPATGQQLEKGITRLVHTLRALNSRRRRPIQLREMELIKKKTKTGYFCHAASGRSLAVQSDGSLFPCSQTIGDPFFNCGSINEPHSPAGSLLTRLSLSYGDCGTCPLLNKCPGDCPSRIHYNRTTVPTLACELYRVMYSLA